MVSPNVVNNGQAKPFYRCKVNKMVATSDLVNMFVLTLGCEGNIVGIWELTNSSVIRFRNATHVILEF